MGVLRLCNETLLMNVCDKRPAGDTRVHSSRRWHSCDGRGRQLPGVEAGDGRARRRHVHTHAHGLAQRREQIGRDGNPLIRKDLQVVAVHKRVDDVRAACERTVTSEPVHMQSE